METARRPSLRLRQARVQALQKLLPLMLGLTAIDALSAVVYFWPQLDHRLLLVWSALALVHIVVWWRFARGELWLFAFAAVEGLLFALFLVGAVPRVPPEQAAVLAAFTTGLVAAGGLSMMADPKTSLVFTGTLTVGAFVAFAESSLASRWMIELVILGFAAAQTILVSNLSRMFDARVTAEDELDRQKTLVPLLLTDFEESASEGLWETDAQGRLTLVSQRLAELLGISAEELLNLPLLPPGLENTDLDRSVPFRNLVVPVEFAGLRRWWSLTGKPLKDAQGRVTGWRGVGSDVSGARQRELEVLRLSRHDGLTGLLNRLSFRALLDDLLAPDRPVTNRCLALIDLVNFKDVNEARGHAFGDALLQEVAERLRRLLPAPMIVARLGGDEFALLAPVEQSAKDTSKRLKSLLTALQEPYVLGGERFESRFRIGVSFSPQDATASEQWVRCSDLALRMAKARGGNQLVVFTPELLESFHRHNALRVELGAAIGRDQLWVAFQPIVDLNHGQVTGFEALVRWDHPVRGTVAPSEFIPVAEETELILTLGLWVLEQACREALKWPPDTSVSVNVSGVQLRRGSLAEDVAEVLSQLRFNPRRLILEVTESALIKDDPRVGPTLEALKAQGIRLALDDFGTGY